MEDRDISLLVISILGLVGPLIVILFERGRGRFVGRPSWILKKNLKEKKQKTQYNSLIKDWDNDFKK